MLALLLFNPTSWFDWLILVLAIAFIGGFVNHLYFTIRPRHFSAKEKSTIRSVANMLFREAGVKEVHVYKAEKTHRSALSVEHHYVIPSLDFHRLTSSSIGMPKIWQSMDVIYAENDIINVTPILHSDFTIPAIFKKLPVLKFTEDEDTMEAVTPVLTVLRKDDNSADRLQ